MASHVLLPDSRNVSFADAGARLRRLIGERAKPGADQAAIDARIWDLFGEEWAMMFTDLSGFSRHVAEFGVIHFLQTIHESLRIHAPVIEAHDGNVLKVEGDSLLVLFRKPRQALAAAVEMQRASAAYNEGRSDAEQVLLCVGLGYGSVLRIGDLDVYGAQVNAASKLGEDTAEPWEILVTGEFARAIDSEQGVSFEPIDFVPPGATDAFRAVYTR